MNADDRLIVALDVPNLLGGGKIIDILGDSVSFYKIGLGMLTGGGLALANELKDNGYKVFLDMKFFDIGATVEKAVLGISQYNFDFLTVHGDPHVVRAAVKGRGDSSTKILAVTILTSLDRNDLDESLIKSGRITDLVTERAKNAFKAGADGIIASPQEAALIRALPESQGKLIITPGVRPDGSKVGDQKRITTPSEAIKNGADHIVIGRPIWASKDPLSATKEILNELKNI